jgi:hypothetical protein
MIDRFMIPLRLLLTAMDFDSLMPSRFLETNHLIWFTMVILVWGHSNDPLVNSGEHSNAKMFFCSSIFRTFQLPERSGVQNINSIQNVMDYFRQTQNLR